nr:p7 [Sweet potato chlorotic stunt virus]
MDYSFLSNQCFKQGILYNPKKCEFDVIFFWVSMGILITIFFFAVISALCLCRFRRF